MPEERDHRAKATMITSKGKEIIEHLEGISIDLEKEIKSSLDPADFQIARQVLQSLYHILIILIIQI